VVPLAWRAVALDAMSRQASYINEKMPPGGSSFGGHFHKEAFNAYVYPKPGARRMERLEHRANAMHPAAHHQANISFTMAKEMSKPSRLRAQTDKYNEMKASKGPTMWENVEVKFKAQQQAKLESGEVEEPEPGPPKLAPGEMPKQWNPHPSLLRGKIGMCRSRALDWGVDITRAKAYDCPFWEAPRHRFEGTASLPEARPVTPTRSLRWRTAEDWNNPEMHPPLKVSQTLPKSNSMIELSRERFCAQDTGGRWN